MFPPGCRSRPTGIIAADGRHFWIPWKSVCDGSAVQPYPTSSTPTVRTGNQPPTFIDLRVDQADQRHTYLKPKATMS